MQEQKIIFNLDTKQYFTPLLKELVGEQSVQINEKSQFYDQLPYLKQWKVNKLIIQRKPLFLKQLSTINLSELKNVICTQCGIDSIEIINQCNFPKLQSINIGQNNITRLKSMRKGQWEQLKYVGLLSNPISDYQFLSQCCWLKLTWLILDFSSSTISRDSASWITKLQTKTLSKIWISSNGRIQEKGVLKGINHKWMGIWVKVRRPE